MSLRLEVARLGGKTRAIQVSDELRQLAQTQLGVGPSRLLSSFGATLSGPSSVESAGLQSGEVLTLHTGQIQVTSSSWALAAILGDGSVATWGRPERGGDCSQVQERLKGVRQIRATERAFAAVLDDGSVVIWGDPEYGGAAPRCRSC